MAPWCPVQILQTREAPVCVSPVLRNLGAQHRVQLGAFGRVGGRHTKLLPPTTPGRVWYRLGERALENDLGCCRHLDEQASLFVVATDGRVGVFVTGPGGVAAGILVLPMGGEVGEGLAMEQLMGPETGL